MEGKIPKRLSFSFLPIPEELMKSEALSFGAKFLFGIIAKTNLEEVRLTLKYLANRMGCSQRQAQRRVEELKNNGFILLERTGRSNKFRINFEFVQIIQTPDKSVVSETAQNTKGCRIRDDIADGMSTIKNVIKETSKEGNPVAIVRGFFIDECKKRKRIEPEMAFGKEGKLLKEKLKRYSVEQLIDLVDKFLNSEIGERLGWTLSICLSAPVINQWLIGKLEKSKKPFFRGNPMKKIYNNKWQVLENGQWLEFAGKESEIIYQ